MRYEEHPAPPTTRRHIECLWTLSSEGLRAPREAGSVLPDGGVEVVVSLAEGVRRAGKAGSLARMFVGPLDRPVRILYRGRVELVAARFRPAAAGCIVRRPMRALLNGVHRLADVAPPLDRVLQDAFATCAAPGDAVRAFGSALSDAIGSAPPPDPVAEETALRILRGRGRLAVATLAHALGVGERTLERRFDEWVGISPRRLARVLRFRGAWQDATEGSRRSWSLLALEAGYADQSHLIREFRSLAGTSPARLRDARGTSRRTNR